MSAAAVAGTSPERRRRRRERRPDGEPVSSGDERLRVKAEPDDDIKDYAETTMNELLGWYGYDKVDTRGINLRAIHNFPPSSSSSSSPVAAPRHRDDEDNLSDEDDNDTGQSLSPPMDSEPSPCNVSGSNTILCDWCKKSGLKLFTLKTSSETKAFCSEPCFSQCRRAAFKKSRVCDWCKHVRHTVNYVDFQDGDHQLQFCSDKCLNQYKMHIFCKETQAYLQMHPHLQEAAKSAGSTTSKLITPDLWLRDCHEQEPVNGNQRLESRSDEDKASSGSTSVKTNNSSGELEDLTVASRSDRCSSSNSNPPSVQERDISQHEPSKNSEIPSARENPPAKMCNDLVSYLKSDRSYSERRKRLHDIDKGHPRKRDRISSPRHKLNLHSDAPPAHLSSHSPLSYVPAQCRGFPSSSSSPFHQPLNNSPSSLNPPAAHSNTLPPHPGLSTPSLPPGLPPPPPLLNNSFLHQPFNPPYFQPNLNFLAQQQQMDSLLRMQAGFGLRHNSPMCPPPPQLPHSFPEFTMPPHVNPANHNNSSLQPPNTIMLPYPVIVPLPVPIPVPIPLSHFLLAAQKSLNLKKAGASGTTSAIDGDKECTKSTDYDVFKSAPNKTHRNSEQESSRVCKAQSSQCDSPYSDRTNEIDKSQFTNHDKSSYAVTNSDSGAHRMVLTRTKFRHGVEEKPIPKKK